MGEMGRAGGPLPHDQQSTGEHFKEVEEDLRHDHEADRIANAHPKRPWWRFWSKPSG